MSTVLGGLRDAAQADVFSTAAGTALVAVMFHLSIGRLEFERILFHFLASLPLIFIGLSFVFARFGECNLREAIAKSLLVEVVFNTSLLASIGIYRLAFHRCRRFPGLLGSKLSRFYTAYLASKNIQYYKELRQMHTEHGDFVRTGPREITIFRASAVATIYGPGSVCSKATWYGQTGNDPKKCSLHMTRDFNDHRVRRRAWDRGFSIKALATYEPRIKTKTDLLIDQLRQRKSVNITDWSMFFSFDTMGEVGFGKDFGNLVNGIEHSAIRPIHEHIKMVGVLSPIPWLLYLLSSIPGATGAYAEIFNFCSDEIKAKQKEWDNEKYPNDIVSWLLKAVHEKDVSAAPSAEALDDDARIILLAGSDTTATTLSHSLFHLVKYPETQKKMQKLVDEAMPSGYNDWSYEKVKDLKYIDDFIFETLRLKPALIHAGPRETPPEGIQIDEIHIPGNTNVVVCTQHIQRDPRYWQKAEEFIPERWSERRAEMETDKGPYLPFLLGAYSCPGKNVALMSVRMVLSAIVQNFHVSFAPGETGENFDKEVLDTFTVTLPPLHLSFTARNRV